MNALLIMSALAINQQEEIEKKAQKIFKEVICVTCRGQVIAESDTIIAKAMRHNIRAQLVLNQTEEQIKQQLVHKYGEQILISPPFNKYTYLLWSIPWLLMISGLIIFIKIIVS